MLRFPSFGTLVGVTFALVLTAFSDRAAAVEITDVGQTFDIAFDGNIDGSDVEGLSGLASFEVVSMHGSRIVLDITLTNTSETVLWSNARISAFGFDTSRNLRSASLSSGEYDHVNLRGRFPNHFGNLDLCVINNRNNCSGGGNGGLQIGESETMRLTLNFRGRGAVDLDNFGVRYQSVSSANARRNGGLSGTGHGTVSNPIPEPRSTALFLLGFAMVAFVVRKQVLTGR